MYGFFPQPEAEVNVPVVVVDPVEVHLRVERSDRSHVTPLLRGLLVRPLGVDESKDSGLGGRMGDFCARRKTKKGGSGVRGSVSINNSRIRLSVSRVDGLVATARCR